MSIETVANLESKLRALQKFPDSNPNPVLKADRTGMLLYFNNASQFIVNAWSIECGNALPTALIQTDAVSNQLEIELPAGHRTYKFNVVFVPELDSFNIYGTDVTAMKSITKFPDQNPNPIMRVSSDCKLQYSNIAGKSICEHWEISVGGRIPDGLIHGNTPKVGRTELNVDDKVYVFDVVHVPEFEFYNYYITDVTDRKEKEAILGKLAKYFSPQVYDSIFTGDLEVKIQTSRKKLTVFFSDIKGFSQITERLQPEVLTQVLTEYLTAMTRIAIKHGGTVDKYIGDAIMVFFGDPHSQGTQQDAISCVEMAMEMKTALVQFRTKWRTMGISQPMDIRIGIHSDTCTVGNFGSEDRLDYTTIGNGVNLASRLESNAGVNQILISEDTYLLIQDAIICEKKEQIMVKNIAHPIQTYEVRGHRNELEHLEQISVQDNGFSLEVDPHNLGNIPEKKKALEDALALLNLLE